jgi:hypothetical protein
MIDMSYLAKRLALSCVLACALATSAFAADIAGKWKADFSTQIGDQHYIYTFVVDGEKLTGTARSSDFGETAIAEGTVKGDNISFVEYPTISGQEIKRTYTGKLSGDEIKFTRTVFNIAAETLVATEELVAKRQK